MRETTKGSAGKLFTYKLNRMKLREPIIRLEGTPNEFVIAYASKIRSVSNPPPCKKTGQTGGRRLKRTIRKNRMRPNNVRRSRRRSAARR